MGSNKFSRALGHLKSTGIDEKIRLLDEQPTNNTSGIYTDEPERTVTTTLNPNLNPLDLTQDDPTQNGRDTSGLFMPDGTILTEEPPGDTSYILGPMAAMYYTWSYPWTMIGYIRQSDRKMVNLGRIDGRLSDWDGSAGSAGSGTGTFYSYGQLTVEQARWFRDVQKQPGATNHPNTYNYYAFYPGPPSQTPDANGRYPCVITGVSKNRTTTTQQKPTQKPINPDWGLSGYMFIKNKKTGEWEKKYYYNDGTTSSEISGEMTPDNPFYDAYQRGGGDQAAENGYSREEIIRAGNEQIQREADQQARQDYQDTLRNMSDKPLTIDDFKSAADYSAYKNGGGDAARQLGRSVEDIINQGIQNLNQYNQDSRISDRMRQDAQRAELNNKNYEPPKSKRGQGGRELGSTAKRGGEKTPTGGGKTPTLTPAQAGKIVTNIAGGTPVNPSLQAYGGSSKGLGGEIKLGQHGTGQQAAQGIKKSGFKSGSRQNVYGTKGVFLDPSASGAAADDFARAGAAAEAGGRGTAGRTATQRAADLKAAGQGAGKGTKIPVAYKPGTGSRMNIPGTKYAEVGVDASKATKGARLAQNAITKYPNSAKAQQLITRGATTAASKGTARTVAKTLGKAVPFAGAAISVADAADRISKGDVAGALLSGLTAVPGPVGWTALATQIVTDNTGLTGGGSRPTSNTSTSGRGAGRKAFVKEENEYSSYQEYVDKAKEVIDRDKVNLGKDEDLLNALKSELGLHDKLSDKDKEYLVDLFDNSEDVNPEEAFSFLNKIIKKLSSGKKKVSKSSLPRLPKRTNKDSSVNESFSGYTRKRILREIKKETIIPDERKEKLKGYRPKTFGKLHAQYDTLMQKAENPASFKPMDETTWTKRDKYFNSRLSQERKNEVLDHIGTSDHYWDILCETGKKSREKGLQEKYGDYTLVRKEELAGDTLLFLVDENGKKESILQSEYSDRIARQIEEPLWEQETLNAPNDPLIKRIRGKLATQINYPDKPSPMGYPDGPTPEQVDGYHPEYGKRAAYYNALDTHSADAMPPTGDPEIDAKVNAQKTPVLKRVSAIRKKKGKPNS